MVNKPKLFELLKFYYTSKLLLLFLGQPYAGGNRIGSAPLRKYTSAASGNIRGSGALANRSVSIIVLI